MRPTHRIARAALLAVVLLSHAACKRRSEPAPASRRPAVAQLSGPDLVPMELVAALLGDRTGPRRTPPEIVVGRPSNLPFEFPSPAGARIVGAMTYRSGGTLVFATEHAPLDAVRAYERALQQSGWQEPRRGAGGFRPPDVVYSYLCQGERHSLNISGIGRPEGGSFLRVGYATYERGSHSPCEQRRADEVAFQRGPIPTLYPPEGAAILGGSTGGSREYTEAHARLKTDLRPPQLVAHYGAQAREQGWSLQSESAGPESSAQIWRLQDRDAQAWVALLLAHAVPGSDDRVVLFRVIPQIRQGPP